MTCWVPTDPYWLVTRRPPRTHRPRRDPASTSSARQRSPSDRARLPYAHERQRLQPPDHRGIPYEQREGRRPVRDDTVAALATHGRQEREGTREPTRLSA